MKTRVNPMSGWANNPYLIIQGPYPDLTNAIYNVTEGCYWYQGETTDFLFHCHAKDWIKVGEDHYKTPPSEGFGGRVFSLRVNFESRVVLVDLVGPWSGGSYCANQYLPEPTLEVTCEVRRYSHIAGYLTWKQIEEICPSGWSVQNTMRNGRYWSELVFLDKPKSEWSQEVLDFLQDQFDRSDPYRGHHIPVCRS